MKHERYLIAEVDLARIRYSRRYRLGIMSARVLGALFACSFGVAALALAQVVDREMAAVFTPVLFYAIVAAMIVSFPVVLALYPLVTPYMRDDRGLPSMEKMMTLGKVAFRDLFWLRRKRGSDLVTARDDVPEAYGSSHSRAKYQDTGEFYWQANYRATIAVVRPFVILGTIGFISMTALTSLGGIEQEVGIVALVTTWLIVAIGLLIAWRKVKSLAQRTDHTLRPTTNRQVLFTIIHDVWKLSIN